MRWRCNAEELTCDRCGEMTLVDIGKLPKLWHEWEERPEVFGWRKWHEGSWHSCANCAGFEHVPMEPVRGWKR